MTVDPPVAPTVSAVMAARDAASTIAEAVTGVLEQTFEDWELIVVDDGSTDGTSAVVRAFDDPRIRVHRLDAGAGRGGARNVALALARGRYVAICDADDVSLPERFTRQVAVLDASPDLGVVGGQVLNFDTGQAPRQVYRYPTTTQEVEQRFARGQMPMPHQATMIRRDLITTAGGYSPQCLRAQDLELFLRLRPLTQMVNLDEAVLLYRHPGRTPLAYWLSNGRWRRYAVTRARASLAGAEPVGYQRFVRRPATLVALAWDTASYLRARLHQRRWGVRAL